MQEPEWARSRSDTPQPAKLFSVDIESLFETLSWGNILASLEGQFDPEVVELAKEYLAKAELELVAERTAKKRRSRKSRASRA
jgi:hypothetical protein